MKKILFLFLISLLFLTVYSTCFALETNCPNLVLIDGHKNGKPGLKILDPLYVHNDDGSYTEEVLKMFGK